MLKIKNTKHLDTAEEIFAEFLDKFQKYAAEAEEVFKKVLGDRTFDRYEIDSTGVSDNFVSVEKLVKSFLHNEENKRRERIEILDWVKKELSD